MAGKAVAMPHPVFTQAVPMSDALKSFLATRRSTPFPLMAAEGPDGEELSAILTLAARVPDHGKMAPWRFIVIGAQSAASLGAYCAERLKADTPDASEAMIAAERARFTRSPVTVAVVSAPREHFKVPVWEQELSAGALCYNLELAAMAHGYGVNWITGWPSFDAAFAGKLGLNAGERLAGFIHIGRATAKAEDRERPDMAKIVSHLP